MADSTLSAIRVKVRRLTRSLSEAQLSTAQIDEYINTFVLYDFPEHLRLFNLKETFTFFTEPYIDTYTTSTDAASPLYEFRNKYISVHQPVYIAGFQAWYVEDRGTFFGVYPKINNIASTGHTGDAVTTSFTGFIPGSLGTVSTGQQIVLLRDNILLDSLDANSNGLSMIDYPISASIGNLYVPGGAPTSTTVQDAANYINYLTGQYVVTFTAAPGSGEVINSQTIIVQPGLPQSMLFFDDIFTLRPVPDQTYRVQIEVFVRPTELLTVGQEPKLQEWWQYIAYSAAKKIFEDRMDYESLNMMMPALKEQERLIQRRTLVQQTSQRTSTIYTDQSNNSGAYGSGWFSGGGSF